MIYIVIASYTMVSLITGIISESLIREQHEDEAHKMKNDHTKSCKGLGDFTLGFTLWC